MLPENPHILVIEDDPAIGESLRAGLQEDGYQVTWRTNGRSGVDFALAHAPHLIILDIRLPDGLGFDFCRQLRQASLKQPILMLTARRDELDKVLGLEMGADDYMTKPFGLRELLARVRALIRRAYGELAVGQDPGHVIQIQDITIDLAAAEVQRGGQAVNLTPTEFRLLAYLARHTGQALSRAQLLQGVWRDAFSVESERTVNVHIRRLREKVEVDPSQPVLILTVPGIGYRLVK